MSAYKIQRRRFLQASGLSIASMVIPRKAAALFFSPFPGSIIHGDGDRGFGGGEPWSFIMRIDGETGERVRLTNDNRLNRQPAVHPLNLDIIAYASQGSLGHDLRIMTSDGRLLKVLTDQGRGSAITPAWDPEGRRLAYTWLEPPNREMIRIHDLVTGSDISIVADGGKAPSWAPDGSGIIYHTNRPTGLYQIWFKPFGGFPYPMTEAYYDESIDANIEMKVATYSPDGTQIAYFRGVGAVDDGGSSKPTGEVPRDVWVMDADGSRQRYLISASDNPFWAPDSSTVGVTQILAHHGISSIDVDGRNQRLLFESIGTDVGRPVWLPY